MLNRQFPVEIERLQIAHIPSVLIHPYHLDTSGSAVILYHGWGMNKESQIFMGSVLACHGFWVLIPDALYHGQRETIDHGQEGAMERSFLPILMQTVEEAGLLMEFMNTQAQKIGVLGISMGGFSGSGVFVTQETLKCLVVFNGSCAWREAARLFMTRRSKGRDTGEAWETLKLYDPLEQAEKLRQRPLLMMHGEEDTVVPMESQKIFVQKVAPLYKEVEERFQFIPVPHLNHHVTMSMMEKAIRWFQTYL